MKENVSLNGKKLNIVMLGHKRIPSREGGIEVIVGELSTRMVKLGHQVTCLNRRGHHVSGKEFDGRAFQEYKGVKIKTVPTINKKGLAAVSSSFFAAFISAFGKYDIVHFHAEGPAAMCWLPKLFGKRVIVTIHGLDHHRVEKWGKFARKYIIFGEKCAVRYADEIIVLSRNIQKYFSDIYGRKTVFIPNGIDKPKTLPAKCISEKFGLKKDGYILFLGRLAPEKGVQYLIKAFKRLNTDKKLVIAGGSSDTDKFMQKLKKLAWEDQRIIFTGFVEGKIMDELYSNAYIYCLPSDIEGMPLSLLEAMSYGNCCLTSNISECVEVVRDKAFCFQKSNVNDLYEKLQYLLKNEEITRKYKLQSADYICKKYRWDNVVDMTLKVYIKGENSSIKKK